MRGWRAARKRSGLGGLARLVDELEHTSAADLDLGVIAAAIVNAGELARQIWALEDRLAELTRRYLEAS